MEGRAYAACHRDRARELTNVRASKPQPRRGGWLRGLRAYLASIAIGHLTWEMFQLPLYTIWQIGTFREQAFAVAHCTLGDILIALSTLALALLLAGHVNWPERRFFVVGFLAVLFGVGYTVFSEWLNVVVRASWAYSERMPVITLFGFDVGVAPLLQWVVVPTIGFAIVRFSAVPLRRSIASE